MGHRTRFVVLGGANFDIQAKSVRELRRGDSNPGVVTCRPGGVGRNIAENLGRLGEDVSFVGILTDDERSTRILRSLEAAGDRVDGCIRIPDRTCPTYVSIFDADGDILDSAGIWIVDTNLSLPILHHLAARPRHAPIVLDTVSVAKAVRAEAVVLAAVTALKSNRSELLVATGHALERPATIIEGDVARDGPEREDEGLARAIDAVHAFGTEWVFVSLGRRGLIGSRRDPRTGATGRFRAELSVRPAQNVNGAGDAQTALIALGIASAWPLEVITARAVAAAALTLADDSPVFPGLSLETLEDAGRNVQCIRVVTRTRPG